MGLFEGRLVLQAEELEVVMFDGGKMVEAQFMLAFEDPDFREYTE